MQSASQEAACPMRVETCTLETRNGLKPLLCFAQLAAAIDLRLVIAHDMPYIGELDAVCRHSRIGQQIACC
jgi:hypothetical protein